VIGPTLCDPLTGSVPDQPPDALQLVTFALDHVSVVEPLRATPGGLAEIVIDGVPAVTVTLAVAAFVPPAPEQESVKLELAVNAPVL